MSYSIHVFPIHLWATGKYILCRYSHRLHSANTAQRIAKMSGLTSFEAQMFSITQALFSTVHWKPMEASLTTAHVLKLLVQRRLLKLKISFRWNDNYVHILKKKALLTVSRLITTKTMNTDGWSSPVLQPPDCEDICISNSFIKFKRSGVQFISRMICNKRYLLAWVGTGTAGETHTLQVGQYRGKSQGMQQQQESVRRQLVGAHMWLKQNNIKQSVLCVHPALEPNSTQFWMVHASSVTYSDDTCSGELWSEQI